MRGTTRTVAVAAMSAVALLAAGCGSGNDSGSSDTSAAAKTGGEITVRGCNPQNPLVPLGKTAVNLTRHYRRPLSPGARIAVRLQLKGLSTTILGFKIRADGAHFTVRCQPKGARSPRRCAK